VKLSGHKPSIKLEEPFWQAIGEIAQARGCSISALIRSVAAKRVDDKLSSTVRVFLEHFRAAHPTDISAPRPESVCSTVWPFSTSRRGTFVL
jgi:predicted DNA-binding ribbon-helix-helix protein